MTAFSIESSNTAPTLTLISGDFSLGKNLGFSDPGATALDAQDGDITDNIIVTGVVDTHTPGAYTLTYTITDSGGLSASTTRTVTITQGSSGGGGGGNGAPVQSPLQGSPQGVVLGVETTAPQQVSEPAIEQVTEVAPPAKVVAPSTPKPKAQEQEQGDITPAPAPAKVALAQEPHVATPWDVGGAVEPLRLTATAAQPGTPLWVWIWGALVALGGLALLWRRYA